MRAAWAVRPSVGLPHRAILYSCFDIFLYDLLRKSFGRWPVASSLVGRFAQLGPQTSIKPRNPLYMLPTEPQPDCKHI